MVGRCCRTRRQNAHVIDGREVLYPWHPWFGLGVHVHQTIDKRLAGVFRCSLDGVRAGRWIELPAWMFERSTCLPMRIASSPRVQSGALVGLQNLLREPTNAASATGPSRVPVSGAGRDPRHQNRRSTDAKPAPRSRETPAASLTVRSVPHPGSRAAMAALAAVDPVGGDDLDGAPVERASAARTSGRRGRAAR